jgi:hypothetical protein
LKTIKLTIIEESRPKTGCLPIFQSNNNNYANSFFINIPMEEKKFHFLARNKQEKASWIEAFKKC